MLAKLIEFFLLLIACWFRRSPPPLQQSEPARAAPPIDVEPTPLAPEPAPELPPLAPPLPLKQPLMNRQMRRSLERARRRQDKFVVPKGPRPISVPRGERTKPPEPTIEFEEATDEELWEAGPDGQAMGIAESELWGEFNFRDTILEQLERYFVYLDRMQTRDPDSYALYKEIGATVLPPYCSNVPDGRSLEDIKEQEKISQPPRSLPTWFNERRPTFGCFAYGIDPKVEQHELATGLMIPKFMYFKKYENPPPELQPMSGGDTYVMTVWWDRPHDRKPMKWGTPENYGVLSATRAASPCYACSKPR
jgi:hypothetical protein